MSGQVVPKRFGLKYSPKPAIALEYQKPDSGAAGKETERERERQRASVGKGVAKLRSKANCRYIDVFAKPTQQLKDFSSRTCNHMYFGSICGDVATREPRGLVSPSKCPIIT